jgi:hypothetical protein
VETTRIGDRNNTLNRAAFVPREGADHIPRSRDVGDTPIHMVAPRAGAGDPAGVERDVPHVRQRCTIQIRKQRADSGNVVRRAAPVGCGDGEGDPRLLGA